MNDFLEIMTKPFSACVVLTAIHVYLGLHVIDRGVIFVDLALAQMAALGATIGYMFGYGLHSTNSYFLSLTFALAGAVAFAITRAKKPVVPHEAIIGVVYAIAGAASILALSRAPEGGEELKSLLVGHLLFIDWSEVRYILVLYSIVACIHWAFREKLLLISQFPEKALSAGLNIRFWDFIFYSSFALVVTSSVEIAGVLLVFAILIVPAICGAFLANSVFGRLSIGWLTGLLTCAIGTWLSYTLDFPTGAMIVVLFGLSLIVCWVIRVLKYSTL